MKLCLLFAALLTGRVLAETPRAVALDGPLGSGVPALVERFLGEDAVIPAIFLGAPEAGASLTASVYLDGGALAAPMTRGVAFQSDAPSSHPALIEGKFVLPKPAVDKPLMQLVRVETASGAGQPSLVVSFRLRWVSTQECRSALERAVTSGEDARNRQIVLFGELPGLREMLRSWNVPFEDTGKEFPLRIHARTVAIGEGPVEAVAPPTQEEHSSLLLLRVRPVGGLEVWHKDTGSTRTTTVSLPRSPDWRQSPFLIRILTGHLDFETP